MMKISVICTLKNEELSIKDLIDSLLTGYRRPDEIILVDGGSKDKTNEIILSYIEEGHPIKLIMEENINIAKGRNIAIEASRYDIIASIDAGCRAHIEWLKEFQETFEKDSVIDVVAGFYLPDPKSEYENLIGDLLYPKLHNINPKNFLPSSRSIAFKKKCWQAVGGYPEYLYTGEDTSFDISLKEAGFKFAFSENAIVYWRPRSNLAKLFKQYYLYAKGATEAGILNTITFQAYGQNVFHSLIYNIIDCSLNLIAKGKMRYFIYIPAILLIISVAKLCGIVIGRFFMR